jgi:pimeloyl-ACP methyl ester carboxylesterase
MKTWLLPLFFTASACLAGPACLEPANRYANPIFDATTRKDNIQYGQNKNPLFNNRVDKLLMNVFQPKGDPCSKRPLVLFMHGGWMQSGDHNGENESAEQFAKRGFVSASIGYRLGIGGTFSPKNFVTPGFMATQDARAAIRYFRKHAKEYGIDTGFIYLGGCSAGAYASLLTAYLDKTAEIPASVDSGALEGTPGFSSRFNGVLALSGGLLDTNWMDRGDVSLVAVQCSADPLVPSGGDQLLNPNTQVPFIRSFGATAIKTRADNLGINASLLTYRGDCHCPRPVGPDGIDSTMDFFGKSLYNLMTVPAGSLPRKTVELGMGDFLSPSKGERIHDLAGKRMVAEGIGQVSQAQGNFKTGLYLLRK